jgi:hypothetical protein
MPPFKPLVRLIEVLDRFEIAYQIGGSVASSAHGIPRTTLDVDLVVDMAPELIADFASELDPDFYADAELIRQSRAQSGGERYSPHDSVEVRSVSSSAG